MAPVEKTEEVEWYTRKLGENITGSQKMFRKELKRVKKEESVKKVGVKDGDGRVLT